jgi:hypothetical protein
MVFWKGCYRVDVLCGYTCGDGFVLGFSFGVVENLVHMVWCFWGVCLWATFASPYRCCACGSGASLSRLQNIYFHPPPFQKGPK